jgi:hypothetical protein
MTSEAIILDKILEAPPSLSQSLSAVSLGAITYRKGLSCLLTS